LSGLLALVNTVTNASSAGYDGTTGTTVQVNCPAGAKLIGGGGQLTGDAYLKASYPSGNSWIVTGVGRTNGGAAAGVVTAYATCVGP